MPKNKPKHRKAGGKPGAVSRDAARGKKPEKSASKGKIVALDKGARSGRAAAAAGVSRPAVARSAASRTASAKRLRFLPPAAVEGVARLRAGAGQSWQRLLIRLRLSRSAQAPVEPGAARAQQAAASKGAIVKPGAGKGTPGRRPRPAATGAGRFTAVLTERWGALKCRPVLAQAGDGVRTLLKQALTFEGLMAILLAIMLFYPPFFSGLFFQSELLLTHMLTAAVFALFAFYMLMRGELVFFERPLDYAVFVLLGLYVTSSIDAWNARDAIAAALKMANYVAVYWLLAYSARSLAVVRGYLAVLLASGAGVALLGMGAAIGTFQYEDAFVGGRIYSSLQHPNTLAAFLTAINLLGLYLWNESRNRAAGTLLAVANYLIFLALLGTQSQGGFLIYPVGLLLLLLGLPGRERWRTLGCFAMQLVASLAVIGGMMANTGGQHQLFGWLWALAGAVLVSLFHLAWQYAGALRQSAQAPARRLRPWVTPAIAVLTVLILAGGGFALWHQRGAATYASKALPQDIMARIKTISMSDINVQERLTMNRDAIKIMAASPLNALLGAGGGGWNATYHQYQSHLYNSPEVYNHFLQVGVETGFPGLLVLLLIWGFFIATAWSIYRFARTGDRKDPPPQAVSGTAWAMLSGAVALGIHSTIDFNLSLGAVALLLWGLFGLMRGLERLHGPAAAAGAVRVETAALQEKRSMCRHKKHVPTAWKMPPALQGVIVGGLALMVFLGSLGLLMGIQYAQAAETDAKNKDTDAAIKDYQEAVRHDYWNTDYRSILAQYYLSNNDPDGSDAEQALAEISTAVRVNRGDPGLRLLYANCLFQTGALDEGLRQLEQAATLAPLQQKVYEDLAGAYLGVGRLFLERANSPQRAGIQPQDADNVRQEGRADLEQAVAVPRRIQTRMAAVSQQDLKLWTQKGPLLEASPLTYQKAGEAAVLLGRRQEANTYLEASLKDPRLRAETLLWQGLSLQQQQKTSEGQALINEAIKENPDLSRELTAIRAILPK